MSNNRFNYKIILHYFKYALIRRTLIEKNDRKINQYGKERDLGQFTVGVEKNINYRLSQLIG